MLSSTLFIMAGDTAIEIQDRDIIDSSNEKKSLLSTNFPNEIFCQTKEPIKIKVKKLKL